MWCVSRSGDCTDTSWEMLVYTVWIFLPNTSDRNFSQPNLEMPCIDPGIFSMKHMCSSISFLREREDPLLQLMKGLTHAEVNY